MVWVWLWDHDSGCGSCVMMSKALLCCHVISSPFQVCYFCPVSVGHTAIVN